MSNTKHTPGPFRLEIGEHGCFHKGNRVAIVRDWKDGEETGTETVAEVWSTSGDSDIADGHLFAAAPDLLAACEALMPFVEENVHTFMKPACDAARAAINKARTTV